MSPNAELVLRIVAGMAALALVASPVVVAGWKQAQAWYAGRPPASTPDPALADMRLVLEIANRLRLAGCADGVELCEQLLKVMLSVTPPKR